MIPLDTQVMLRSVGVTECVSLQEIVSIIAAQFISERPDTVSFVFSASANFMTNGWRRKE